MAERELFMKDDDCGKTPFVFTLAAVLLTLGLAFIFFYDELYERRYMVNRRRLLKAVRDGGVKVLHVRPLLADNDITEYGLEVYGQRVDAWIWYDGRLSAHMDGNRDVVGLFQGSVCARVLNRKLSKAVESLAFEGGEAREWSGSGSERFSKKG